jgi:hypothetical protein
MVMGLTWEREGEGEGEEEGAGTCGVRRANWNTHGPGSRAADSGQRKAGSKQQTATRGSLRCHEASAEDSNACK